MVRKAKTKAISMIPEDKFFWDLLEKEAKSDGRSMSRQLIHILKERYKKKK